MPVSGSCGLYSGRNLEFRIGGAGAASIDLLPLSAGIVPELSEDCLSGPVIWKVRVSDMWVAWGSRTGYLHPWASGADGQCVVRADADSIFTGRVLTSMPSHGDLNVESCPIAQGLDSSIDWESTLFMNPLFALHLLPGCSIDADFKPVVLPPERGTVLKFGIETGRIPYQYDIAGLASSFITVGQTLYVLESSNGRLLQLDASDMSVTGSWF